MDNEIFTILITFINTWGLPIIVIFMILNGVISFPPSEVILTSAGILIVATDISFLSMLLIVSFSNLFGAYILYCFCKYKGIIYIYKIINNRYVVYCFNLLKITSHIDSLINTLCILFSEKGNILILICRVLPLVRSAISIPAGIAKVPTFKFLAFSLIGIILWACIWLSAGIYIAKGMINGTQKLESLFLLLLLIIFILVSYKIHTFLKKNS